MIKRIFYIFIFAIIAPFLSAQQNRMNLQDILDFKRDSVSGKLLGWLGAAQLNLKTIDRTQRQELVDATSDAVSVVVLPSRKDINISISTGFLMPDIGNMDKIEASFSGMNKGLDNMQLIFTGYNVDGEVVSIDTLKIAETKGWDTFVTMVFIKDVSYMHLLLNIHGSHNNITQVVGLDKIQFIADGKNLIEFPQCNLYQKLVPDIDCITKLSFGHLDSYQRIVPLMNKKILAIGEALHGSESLSESAIEIMKSRILHNNCKLVLLEIPFEKMLSVNRFVLGDERFSLDMIANSLELGLYSRKLLDFFKWVKEYNHCMERKVRVLGLDTPSTNVIAYPMDMFNYFYLMNKSSMSEPLRQFLLLFLTDSRKAMKDAYPSIKNNTDFTKNSDALELKIIEHWWSDWLTTVTSEEKLHAVRDSLMYNNIKYMIELLCNSSETVTLYSHLEHACRDKLHTISHFPLMSYGALLKESFSAEYSVIGLFANEGKVLHLPSASKQVNDKLNILEFVNETLVNTENNYLESILSKLDTSYFYIPSFQLDRSQMYIRIGTNSKQLTNIIYPPHYMDGVIYLKESEIMHIVHDDISVKEKCVNLLKRFDLCRSLIENTLTYE
jgi:erythromycin esterase-like protein